MFVAALFMIAPHRKQARRPSANKRLNQRSSIHTREYYLAIKLSVHSTAWLNLQRIILSVKNQSQKLMYLLYDSI